MKRIEIETTIRDKTENIYPRSKKNKSQRNTHNTKAKNPASCPLSLSSSQASVKFPFQNSNPHVHVKLSPEVLSTPNHMPKKEPFDKKGNPGTLLNSASSSNIYPHLPRASEIARYPL
jgi:hypothetical protein